MRISNRCTRAIAPIIALLCAAHALHAGGSHPTSVERYGLGGHIKPVGLRHGFHVETVAVDSPAELDQFRAKDVIVRVDGEDIRNLDHLRMALAEAYMNDGEVTIAYLRGTSLEPRNARCRFGPDLARPVSRKHQADTR